ncbi:Rrf2 family transcriptional regulator [Nocardia implantans]|uniref:Rrf2 family transcriptional regulator n=1 Tax=Nocardia implantans TaxID=3108168 RepID=A0ABU6B085_9NOCA|nr:MULTISPECIES: Rrf2 family transcriptional regulator [unclassified Nocardia]MBF6195140.1 Rrf2 family transcriptional regulator [Nocardia beijingensis]MEA3530814.1 Rrf2 family transcriptional regulator [Nocardia sp. CDC192]MEB3513056.1 Rrf2 family transcriptional regulator [Nocardia sp. CDC186]
MQLSHFTDIGLRTIMRLAVEDENNSRVTTKLIARQVGASEKHVAKSVSRLVELGLVEAHRGRSGGLFITAAGRAVSVGALVRELEGDRDVVECGEPDPCPLVGACKLRRILADAKKAFYTELDRYSIEELVTSQATGLLHLLVRSTAGVTPEMKEVS